MKPLQPLDKIIVEDYGLVDICNNNDFLMIDTCASTDVNWISLSKSQRQFYSRTNIKYSASVAQKIDYNSLIASLFAGKNLHTTKMVLEEIGKYKLIEQGGVLSSIQQIVDSVNFHKKVVSLENTPEFDMYSHDRYFARLAEMHGLSAVDQDLLLHFFASLHTQNGKCALVTNDRGILETYKSFGYRLPKCCRHKAYSALFSQNYEPSSAKK